jgi:hypothetical protein
MTEQTERMQKRVTERRWGRDIEKTRRCVSGCSFSPRYKDLHSPTENFPIHKTQAELNYTATLLNN